MNACCVSCGLFAGVKVAGRVAMWGCAARPAGRSWRARRRLFGGCRPQEELAARWRVPLRCSSPQNVGISPIPSIRLELPRVGLPEAPFGPVVGVLWLEGPNPHRREPPVPRSASRRRGCCGDLVWTSMAGFVWVLAGVLVVAACGGGADMTAADSELTAAVGATDAASGAAAGGELTTTAASAPAAPGVVRLGDRFEWCGSAQGLWDAFAEAAAAEATVAAAAAEAETALEQAVDELDRAEAETALEESREVERAARQRSVDLAYAAVEPLLEAATGHSRRRQDETRRIAYERAWDAFVSDAAPVEVAFLQLANSGEFYGFRGDLQPQWDGRFADMVGGRQQSVTVGPYELRSYSEEQLHALVVAVREDADVFSDVAAALIKDATAARREVRSELIAAREALDSGDVVGAARAAVAAYDAWLTAEFAILYAPQAARSSQSASQQLQWAIEAGAELGLESIHLDLAGDAVARSRGVAEESRDFWENFARAGRRGYWNVNEQPVRESARFAAAAAYEAILLHSSGYIAFMQSLSESCH